MWKFFKRYIFEGNQSFYFRLSSTKDKDNCVIIYKLIEIEIRYIKDIVWSITLLY
jgi:hypothetical protein